MATGADPQFLFGLLTLQNGLIDQAQLEFYASPQLSAVGPGPTPRLRDEKKKTYRAPHFESSLSTLRCQPLASIGVAHVDARDDRISVVRTTARAWVCACRLNNRHTYGCERNERVCAYLFESGTENWYIARIHRQTSKPRPGFRPAKGHVAKDCGLSC
jgi:hypothetical protein